MSDEQLFGWGPRATDTRFDGRQICLGQDPKGTAQGEVYMYIANINKQSSKHRRRIQCTIKI